MLIILIFASLYGRPYATSLPTPLLPYSEIDKVFEKWYKLLKVFNNSGVGFRYCCTQPTFLGVSL